MTKKNESLPNCFSDIDTVFPMTNTGLRMSPEKCMACKHKTNCLKEAIQKGPKAMEVQEEYVDRAYDSGTIGFWARWSRKKSLHRNAQKKLQSQKK
jgi:hypothetical protein